MKSIQLLLGLILAVVLNLVLAKPAYEAQPALKTAEQSVKAEYDAAEAKIAELPTLQSELAQKEQELSALQGSFPAHEEIGILVKTLQQAADQDGITISEITRQTKPSAIPGFNEVDLGITAKGSFPNLYRYLDWAHDQKRILNVTAINSISGSNHQITVTGYTRNDSEFKSETPAGTETATTAAASGAATTPSTTAPASTNATFTPVTAQETP